MPNTLTGDFDAVLQISVQQINGILATLHQNRIDPARSPSFAHSATLRVGPAPLSHAGDAGRFVTWFSGAVEGLAAAGTAPATARQALTRTMPTGLASKMQGAFDHLDAARLEPMASAVHRGVAEVQISTPTISVPPGTASQVIVHAKVRARYTPDPGSLALGAPIHGEVRARYVLTSMVVPTTGKVLRVKLTSNDNEIEFVPEPGTLNASAASEVAAALRAALRQHFEPLDVPLAADFAFSEVAALGAGAGQALVLPLQLTVSAPAGVIGSITTHLLGGFEFAIAVSREHLQQYLDAITDVIKQSAEAITINVSGPLGSTVYHASVASLAMTWRTGAIDVKGTINLHTESVAPDGYISFTQSIGLSVSPAGAISVVPQGAPAVDESYWLSHSKAVSSVIAARDSALPGASSTIAQRLDEARLRLVKALQTFDAWADATYKAAEVTADGVVLRGGIRSSGRLKPIVAFAETDGGTAFTALHSWVPGGRIDLFEWTWVEQTHVIPWANKTSKIADAHRFVCGKPPGLALARRMCLRIEGTQTDADGRLEPVSGGEYCRVTEHEPILVAPSWWMKMMVPIWYPDPPPDAILGDLITGHINVAGERRTPGDHGLNTLVHVAGDRWDQSLQRIMDGVAGLRSREYALLVILVLPEGSFNAPRAVIEERLGRGGELPGMALQITEDYAGGWSDVFRPAREGGTFFLNTRGEVAWAHHGPLDRTALSAALNEHVWPVPAPRTGIMQLAVTAGQPAPASVFSDESGNRVSLRRLRGRRVLLTFWQSWSSACLRELRYLQRLDEGDNAPFVIAVNGGESADAIATTRRRLGLSIMLAADPDQRLAAEYGVRCWPTTVHVSEEGVVSGIQFGMTHGAELRVED